MNLKAYISLLKNSFSQLSEGNNIENGRKEKYCLAIQDRNEIYWNDQYIANSTGWDPGQVFPALKAYIDQLSDKDISTGPCLRMVST